MSVLPEKFNINIWRGSTYRAIVKIEDDGVARPLTGYAVELGIKTPRGLPVLSLSLGSGITLTGSDGEFEILLTDEQTAAFTWDNGIYELSLTDPQGNKETYLWGGVRLRGI